MTDYRRMDWQCRANKIAEAIKLACCWVFFPPEIIFAVYRLGGDIGITPFVLLVATGIVFLIARFVDRHTKMYRYDL